MTPYTEANSDIRNAMPNEAAAAQVVAAIATPAPRPSAVSRPRPAAARLTMIKAGPGLMMPSILAKASAASGNR